MGEVGVIWHSSFWPWSSFECGHFNHRNDFEDVGYTGGFDPVAGLPPARLSLAVLRSYLVVLYANSASSLLWRGREGVGLDRHSTTVTKVVEGCVYICRHFTQLFLWEERSNTPLSAL